MKSYLKFTNFATVFGGIVLAASANVNVANLIEAGEPLASPAVTSVIALAVGQAVAVRAGMQAWRQNRRPVAVMVFLFVLCGEAFGLFNGAERQLVARETRAQTVVAGNASYAIATSRVASAEETYRSAEGAVRSEAQRGGCRQVCKDLQLVAGRASAQLEAARSTLQKTPPPKSENIIARVTGWSPTWVEFAPAMLFSVALNGLAFVLLAMGDVVPPAPPKPQKPSARPKSLHQRSYGRPSRISLPDRSPTRAEQVAAFCRSFHQKSGLEPSFTEVREGTNLPNSTVSKYRKAAISQCEVESRLLKFTQ